MTRSEPRVLRASQDPVNLRLRLLRTRHLCSFCFIPNLGYDHFCTNVGVKRGEAPLVVSQRGAGTEPRRDNPTESPADGGFDTHYKQII
jgi:hypothetical protein